jgi:S1-C subfamily serine protease
MNETSSIRNLIACIRGNMIVTAMINFIVLVMLLQFFVADNSFAGSKEIEKWNHEINDAIVQVYTVSREPYYPNPWVMLPDFKVVGSGFIIRGNRLLTNAHVIANQVQIEVRNALKSKKYRARVLHVSHEADLALLTVDDNAFFADVTPLEIDVLPDSQQKVRIYGFPEGDTLTITEGIFSRLGQRHYIHSSQSMLAGEILSDITTGHSGSPVIFKDRVVGVIMQANRSGRVAHMVPSPVVEHFLSDISDGIYDGFPDIGLVTDNLDNEGTKKERGLTGNQEGVVVNHVMAGSPAEGLIRKGDVLTSINGHPVDDNGTIELSPEARTHYNHAIEMSKLGDKIRVEVLRDSIIHFIYMTLDKTSEAFQLITGKHYDRQPTYFIYGGIIFSPLTKNILSEFREIPESLIAETEKWPTRDRKEVVVALEVLPADVNRGYHKINKLVITKVNGRAFRDFKDFFELVTSTADPYLAFGSSRGFSIIIDRLEAEESHQHILETYGIRADRSADLQRFHAAKVKARGIYQ